MAGTTVVELKCEVQHSDWGKLGLSSQVARLTAEGDPDYQVNSNLPYAAIWMGIHPKYYTLVKTGGREIPLAEWVKQHQELLGLGEKGLSEDKLPYLFKVKSIRTMRPLQAHPDKEIAKRLHLNRPDVYTDPNHKPKMAIALTNSLVLCGFRPLEEIIGFLDNIVPLRNAIGLPAFVRLKAAVQTLDTVMQERCLKECFSALMNKHEDFVSVALTWLVEDAKRLDEEGETIQSSEGSLVLKINEEFPGNRGIFAVYFLNRIRLSPDEAIMINANVPHSFLFGDFVTCSTCSDNVVRGAITNKAVDVGEFCEMLDYTSRPADRIKLEGDDKICEGIRTISFTPPFEDFGVTKHEVSKSLDHFQLPPMSYASICITTDGKGEIAEAACEDSIKLRIGSVFFVAADTPVNIRLHGDGLKLYRAHAGQ